jgi:8-oxo-dGTP diphosphatase
MRARTLCLLLKGNPPREVLLGFKKIGFGAGKYAGIGGKVEASETVLSAAVRELEEEVGVKAGQNDLQYVGHLTFLFPSTPEWSQVVHVFQTTLWEGDPAESVEMKPVWFEINQLPFQQMWQDAPHWLPNILKGGQIRMRFVFESDNETVREVNKEAFLSDGYR